jgi:hypothetical protein
MLSGIHDFWTWFEQGRKDQVETMFETDTRERNVVTVTVTEDKTMIEAGAREGNTDTTRETETETMGGTGVSETNTDTTVVSGNSDNTSKEKVTGEKRKRQTEWSTL